MGRARLDDRHGCQGRPLGASRRAGIGDETHGALADAGLINKSAGVTENGECDTMSQSFWRHTMSTVRAIFEGGVFRPIDPVSLPEHSKVEFEPRVTGATEAGLLEKLAEDDPGLAAIYEVLSRRHNSGQPDTAE